MNASLVAVGTSGRVGHLVANAWRMEPAPAQHIVYQSRKPGGVTDASHLNWDPMQGAGPLCDWVARHGRLQAMIVLAGVTPGKGQDLSLNTDIALACLAAAQQAGIARVLIASSSAVYGAGDGSPFTETTPCAPINEYGAAKIAMEEACLARATPACEVCCLRIGNVAGADALLLNVTKAPDTPLTIDTFADGHGPIRSYIGPVSLAKVLTTLALQPCDLPPLLNIAAPEPIAMDALADAAGHPWNARPAVANVQQRIILDGALLGRLYSFAPAESSPFDMYLQWKATRLR